MSRFAEQMALSKPEDRLFDAENAANIPALLPINNQLSITDKSLIPQVDPWLYRLTVSGLVKKALSLSLNDIYEEFPKVTLTTTLAQAQISYPFFTQLHWSGIRLRHVLLAAGVDPQARFVDFAGVENRTSTTDENSFAYSLPVKAALSPDILLAYEVNGATLPAEHGFPLCVIAPNGGSKPVARWLREIRLSAHHLPRQSKGIKAIISTPRDSETILDNVVTFEGYAIASGGRLGRVELSADGGRNWTDAKLQQHCNPGEWCFWEACLKLREGTHQIYVRAWDSQSNVSATLHSVRIRVVEDE
jgi:sulfite oxidase